MKRLMMKTIIDYQNDEREKVLLDVRDKQEFEKETYPGARNWYWEELIKVLEETPEEYFDPDTGELLMGDIVISVDKVKEQAEKYGHSQTRELAFLVAHSMLHLSGYDHMEDEERIQMEDMQREILERRGYRR